MSAAFVGAGIFRLNLDKDARPALSQQARVSDFIQSVAMHLTNPATQSSRQPACAGRFYPANPDDLLRMVKDLLDAAVVANEPPPKAIIAPHAGYIYSGPIAASAHARLRPARDIIRRVVLLGPSHYAEFSGLAASAADVFVTPLGPVPVDQKEIARIRSLPQMMVFDQAHEPEHCLEVHLPFLQAILDEFAIVPLLVSEATDEEITEVLATLWGGTETRLVISSDLSHHHDYQTATSLDRATAGLIERLRAEELDGDHACGCRPIRGLLRLARQRALNPRCIDLRNSGDTAGPRDRVVGYGAFTFAERE